ncbi:MAG: nucleotidyltransferase family protein [Cyanobacteriota bacterium]|jgi:predicted nucleotidyltransferase
MAAELLRVDLDPTPPAIGSLLAANLPQALRADLLPALEELVARHHPYGLWLFGSWARGSASRRSDVDLLVMGLADRRLLDAYDAVLEALQPCRLPVQPLVASPALLRKHGDAPFWRSVKAEAIPLLSGCRFP